MRRPSILALLALTISACGDGDEGADDRFEQLVDLVPASTLEDDATLQYVDMDLVWDRRGVGDDPRERLDNLGGPADIATYSR